MIPEAICPSMSKRSKEHLITLHKQVNVVHMILNCLGNVKDPNIQTILDCAQCKNHFVSVWPAYTPQSTFLSFFLDCLRAKSISVLNETDDWHARFQKDVSGNYCLIAKVCWNCLRAKIIFFP